MGVKDMQKDRVRQFIKQSDKPADQRLDDAKFIKKYLDTNSSMFTQIFASYNDEMIAKVFDKILIYCCSSSHLWLWFRSSKETSYSAKMIQQNLFISCSLVSQKLSD